MNINNFSQEALLQELMKDNPQIQQLLALKEKLGQQAESAKKEFTVDRKYSQKVSDAAIQKLSVIACALGACPVCWGEDSNCEECEGVGGCGAFLPDTECFNVYVHPVLNTLLEHEESERRERKPSLFKPSMNNQMVNYANYAMERINHE